MDDTPRAQFTQFAPAGAPGTFDGHRRRTLQALLCGAAGGVWAADAATTLVPEIALRASDGHAVLGAARNANWRVTYIDFWASWCPPCKLSFSWMNQMHELLGNKGLRIVAIGLDRKEADAQRFLSQAPAKFPLALNPTGDTAALLNVQAMPTSFVVSAERRLLYTHRGFRLEDGPELEARLRAALA